MTKEFPTIDYHVEDQIAHITLNRPEVGNAFASTTYGEIREAMALADQDDQVDVVIISGKGKHFCAGGDIQEFNKMLENNQVMEEEDILETGRLAKSLLTSKKPVIAAVNGAAAGAGFGLALASDFIIMDKEASLHSAFIHLALPGDTSLIYTLQKALGTFKAKEHVMLGKPIDAKLAQEYNLTYKIVDKEDLAQTALDLARDLSKLSTNGLMLQKDLFARIFYPELDDFNAAEAQNMHHASKHPDHLEAVRKFLGK